MGVVRCQRLAVAVAVTVLVTVAVLVAALGLSACRDQERGTELTTAPATAPTTTPTTEPATAPATPGTPGTPGTIDIWLGGDVHLGARSDDRLLGLAGRISGAIGIINIEGPVAHDVGPDNSTEERLVNTAAGLSALVERGVRVAGVANNHALDAGPDGVADTRRVLRAAGIAPVGRVAGEPMGRVAGEPAVATDDIAVATDDIAVATDDIAVIGRAGVTLAVVAHDLSHARRELGDTLAADIRASIARAHRRADLVLITFHVLGPPSYLPTRELRQAVDIALDAGADIIAAHGTHVVARVERRDNALIVWGLGNLIFDCECTRESDGLIVRISVSQSGVERATVIPIDAGLHGDSASLAKQPGLTLDLLQSLGTELSQRTEHSASL